jgi:hypothetical protein
MEQNVAQKKDRVKYGNDNDTIKTILSSYNKR